MSRRPRVTELRPPFGETATRFVVDDPDAPTLPIGCIHAVALRSLATAIDKLDDHHFEAGGKFADRPCLRRLESSSGAIIAHISSGPAVGGSWFRLELVRGEWIMRDA